MTIKEAQELLPFYVNGTLDAGDREKIEALLTPEQRNEVRRFGPWWHGQQ